MGSAGQGHAQADGGASPCAGSTPPLRGAPGGRRRSRRPPGFHFGSAHLGREPRCAGRPVHRRAASGGCAMNAPPRFAVVGRVNKGKSSIVATLAEDDTVRIDPRPGTTTEVREYPVRVDGRTLFVLVDTPGFEDAARALAWLRSREVSAAERPARVAELLRAYQGTGEFADERQLLAPILAGANVLYVVDGTRPFRRNYEAEMEILRWTGRPGMALINRIGDEDHAEEWRRALDQYFRIVRDFDAVSATFEERRLLLAGFRELRAASRAALDRVVAASTLAGAAVGGAVDAFVGGASVMAGTAIGGAVGGATALFGLGRRFASVRTVGAGGIAGWFVAARRYWEGGRRFRIGPHAQPNFPWVLLDRALLHS